ncbi:MAG: T9SS type A sorting domain-containing protein [Saprospiraceae bacterium]|nr:T9SS type A sorting domain-containing protein [Saprospiraceae bacterium]
MEGYNYIEGLAGPYYKHAIFYERERSLKYFKKGNEESGEPFTFTVSTSEKLNSEAVSIFPNPVAAGSEIFLKNLEGKERFEIQLIDLYGKQVQSWQLENYES